MFSFLVNEISRKCLENDVNRVEAPAIEGLVEMFVMRRNTGRSRDGTCRRFESTEEPVELQTTLNR